jgi:hypothetical protein
MKSLALLVLLAVASVHARMEAVRLVEDLHAVPESHVEPEVVERLPLDANRMRFRDQKYSFLKGLGNVAGNVIKGWGDSLMGNPQPPNPQTPIPPPVVPPTVIPPTPVQAVPPPPVVMGRMSRLNGAASRISLDDSQCVLCQYLVQRVQGEMSRFTTLQGAGAGDVTLLEIESAVQEPFERFAEDSIVPPPSDPAAGGNVGTPKRFRLEDQLTVRPPFTRADSTVSPSPDPQREQERYIYEQMVQTIYDRLAGMCGTRLPEQFVPYCNPILQNFRQVAEGLRYGDRPDQICMRYDYCSPASYIRSSPHNVFAPSV